MSGTKQGSNNESVRTAESETEKPTIDVEELAWELAQHVSAGDLTEGDLDELLDYVDSCRVLFFRRPSRLISTYA